MDAATGQVLWQKDGLVPMPPASMSKLMTLELLFQRLKDGRIKLTDTLPVSERAWRTQGSKMFVELGTRIAVEDLIRGIIIQSGNDACVVVAEGLGGTVEGFVDLMNKRAKELGLAQSHFVNPDGLPDPPGQLMSALDLAKLARHLIRDYPQYYHYFSENELRLAQHHTSPTATWCWASCRAPTASRPATPMRPVMASPFRPSASNASASSWFSTDCAIPSTTMTISPTSSAPRKPAG